MHTDAVEPAGGWRWRWRRVGWGLAALAVAGGFAAAVATGRSGVGGPSAGTGLPSPGGGTPAATSTCVNPTPTTYIWTPGGSPVVILGTPCAWANLTPVGTPSESANQTLVPTPTIGMSTQCASGTAATTSSGPMGAMPYPACELWIGTHPQVYLPDPVSIDSAFADPDGASAAQISGTADWGDGTTSQLTISSQQGVLHLSGSHDYRMAGEYQIWVLLTDGSGMWTQALFGATVDPQAGSGLIPQVTPQPDVQSPPEPQSGLPFTVTQVFEDPDGGSTADYSALIDWGDGSPASPGSVTAAGGAGPLWLVTGTHAWPAATADARYTATFTIFDQDGSECRFQADYLVYAS